MSLKRAFIVALKILAVDIIFIAIILVLYVVNVDAGIIGGLILLVVIFAVAIYFVLKEVEDMINDRFAAKQMEEELAKEEARSVEKALNWVKPDSDEAKFQPMIDKLISKNRRQGSDNPKILLQSQIKRENGSRQNQRTGD